MKPKIPQLELALQGTFGDHYRFMLKQLLSHLDDLDQQIAQFNRGSRSRSSLLLNKEL